MLAGAVAGLLAAGSAPAKADFRVCNQTLNLLNLAVGYPSGDGQYETEGWWLLSANSCVPLIKGELEHRYVYVYGTDIYGDEAVVGDPAHEGTTPMCVRPHEYFKIPGFDDCWVRGHERVNFLLVDTENAVSWTMFVRDR